MYIEKLENYLKMKYYELTTNPDFDINNPSKELAEYRALVDKYKEIVEKQEKAAIEYGRCARLYKDLSEELEKADNAGDVNRYEEILLELENTTKRLERAEKNYNRMDIEAQYVLEAAEKAGQESHEAADKAAENGDFSFVNDTEATDKTKNDVTNLRRDGIFNKYKEYKALVAEADKNLKHSLDRLGGSLEGAAHKGMDAANAAMDPHGNGGIKVAEAIAMGLVSLSKSGISAVKSIKSFVAKKDAEHGIKGLNLGDNEIQIEENNDEYEEPGR